MSATAETKVTPKLPFARSFRELAVYQKARALQREVFKTTKRFPREEAFSLTDQWRREARSIGAQSGALETGSPADFFTVDLKDPALAGASENDLLASIVFSSSRAAVREVVVGGKPIVSEGQHLIQEEVVERFTDLQSRLWG